MKKNKLFIAVGILLLAITFTSCESTVEGLNDDPNNATTVTTDLLVRQAMLNTASVAESDPARFAGMFTDQFRGGSRQYRTYNTYGVVAANFNTMWNYFTARGSMQAKLAVESAKAEGNKTKEAIATLFEAYYFGEEALLWGDIPYTEANQDKFPDPKYDDQKTVLKSVISKLEGVVSDLSGIKVSSNAYVGNTTLIFGDNNNANWGQIANSLAARYYLALKDYPNALAAAKKGIVSTNQSLEIQHSSANFAENLFYQFQAEQRGGYLKFNNSYFQQLLTNGNANYRGNSKTNEAKRLAYYVSGTNLNVGPGGAFDKSASFPVISYLEVLLIKAEAEIRANNDLGAAIGFLNKARAEWNTKLATTDYQDYAETDFNSGAIANTQAESKKDAVLREVLEEKYLSVIGLPTFYDVNRTNNFLKVPLKGRTTQGKTMIPQRFIYPATEAASNSNFPGAKGLFVKTKVNQ